MIIREATVDDAQAIAHVHVDSWKTTYAGIVPASFLQKLSHEKRADMWKTIIPSENGYVTVAESLDGKIIGFADSRLREKTANGQAGDLTSLYLLDVHHGKGIGKALLQAQLAHLKGAGCTKVYVEVLKDNRTRQFYSYYGADLHETKQIEIGGATLDEEIYVWTDIEKVLAR
ncbi:GNAT superfamily N-acetyltransferase [Alkalihalobacillus xiaoxiensis]|uniref:GNAT superfamily N-acetyltransferase n=1 Tax=Shouchella xiaoxiensis TaxID=766895 RepID=A0ABS2SUM7_9BACI|nr:GNAT family N-acetyltransferase [Shouchella xiaoxiensis]MBM7838876.1 GNAT superfamily N-acetyltransferase [Shouchella xiaoxiensis]